MKKVIVTESTRVGKRMLEAALEVWSDTEIWNVPIYPIGLFEFSYPRGLKWKDYPVVSEPLYKLSSDFTWKVLYLEGADVAMKETSINEVRSIMESAEQIVFSCDPDYRGVHAFASAVSMILGINDLGDSFPAYCHASLRHEEIVKTFLNPPIAFKEFSRHQISYALTKQYFDYNFNVNSFAIIGKTLMQAGVPDARYLSKYNIQALYFINENPNQKEGDYISAFQAWKGTGKYTQRVGLGSPTSYAEILETLIRLGLVERTSTNLSKSCVLNVSSLGESVLNLLHPDCKDFDLPHRVHNWCTSGLEVSKTSIDRYIKSYFGKQKRFLSSKLG